MNWDQVQGKWKQFRGQAHKEWGKLTNDDLDMVEGDQTKLVGRIQERYGVKKEEAERRVDRWIRGL